MRKYSMDNIYEDKTFFMFDRADSTSAESGWDAKAYFVEKDTGRICFIKRFPYGGGKEYARARGEGGVTTLVMLVVLTVFIIVATALYVHFRYEANIIGNAALLIVATILLVPWGLRMQKHMYPYRIEDYQRTKRNHTPNYIDENKREEVLELAARRKGRNLLFVLAAWLFATIFWGYDFIMTASIEAVFIFPYGVAFLLAFAPDIADRCKGWLRAWKMYWSKSLGRKE